jgi:hypothetical protein
MHITASPLPVDPIQPTDSVTELVPGAGSGLAHLSNGEILTRTRHLAGKSNQLLAALLLHLAEIEGRGIHRTRACTSLYAYCIYELRMSEDAAARRSGAAKLVKRFPAAIDAIARGELHLTGLLMLGPHLTESNQVEVLARAKFRTKREIAKLVRTLAPLPDLPDRVEPLRLVQRALRTPTWAEFVESFCPPVRELKPGERPQDWVNDTLDPETTGPEATAEYPTEEAATTHQDGTPSELPPLTAPQVYQMQFTTNEEHVQLVERAKALLSHRQPRQGLGDLHLQAMRLLVAALEKQRFGAPARKGKAATSAKQQRPEPSPRQGEDSAPPSQPPRQRGAEEPDAASGKPRRSRHIPAAIRRPVFDKCGGRCTYVDDRGQRCRETRWLELHHLTPFANGGPHVPENLTLRCRAHNTLAAELDFGPEHRAQRRNGARHESLRRAIDASQDAGSPL